MRMNISVTVEAVSEIAAGPNSVDMADFTDAGYDRHDLAAMVATTIEDKARRMRLGRVSKEEPATASKGGDYPLDPDQD